MSDVHVCLCVQVHETHPFILCSLGGGVGLDGARAEVKWYRGPFTPWVHEHPSSLNQRVQCRH